MNDEDLEHSLKSMRWRKPSPEFLHRSLQAALDERTNVERVSNSLACSSSFELDRGEFKTRRTSLRLPKSFYIPKPLRLPLAACWLLALFFKLNTPDPISAQTRESIAHMPAIDPKQLSAKLEEEQRLTATLLAELDLHHRSPADRRIISTEPVLP